MPSASATPSATVGLRPVGADDTEFLFTLFASTRAEELATTGWNAAQQERFLRQQFAAQRQAYEGNYPGAEFHVIVVAGRPAGRLYLHRRAQEIRVMDLALLPEFRRRGIGTALLTDVLAEGERTGRPVTIHVEVFNPAQRLYHRLGFRPVASNGVYQLMEWTAATRDG